jgi:hypothetical protein
MADYRRHSQVAMPPIKRPGQKNYVSKFLKNPFKNYYIWRGAQEKCENLPAHRKEPHEIRFKRTYWRDGKGNGINIRWGKVDKTSIQNIKLNYPSQNINRKSS